jgi:hypothetical protein
LVGSAVKAAGGGPSPKLIRSCESSPSCIRVRNNVKFESIETVFLALINAVKMLNASNYDHKIARPDAAVQ